MRKSPGWYKEAWKTIRRDVGFKIDFSKPISNSQKGMITRYYNQIKEQTGFRPTYRYSTRSEKNLEAVKKYTGQVPGFPGLRVAYVPIPNGSGKPEIKITKKGKVIVTTVSKDTGEIERTGYIFEDYGDIVKNTDKTIAKILKDDDGKSVAFKMMCGQNESTQSVSAKFVNETVNFYLNEYDNHEKWFFGIIGYTFDNQASFSEYLAKRKEKPKRKGTKRGKKTRRHRRGD